MSAAPCGRRDEHLRHPHLNYDCPGLGAGEAGVNSLIDTVLRIRWALDMNQSPINGQPFDLHLYCHPSVHSALLREPDLNPYRSSIPAEPEIPATIVVNSALPPGGWQIVVAQGVIPR